MNIQLEKQQLYESPALRDELDDDEATILLSWGESQVERLAKAVSGDDFDQQARFLRQLIKGINRFVGQREFNDRAGQLDYLSKVSKWLGKLPGFVAHSPEELLATLPAEANMARDLQILLTAIIPGTDDNQPEQPAVMSFSAQAADPLPEAASDTVEHLEPNPKVDEHLEPMSNTSRNQSTAEQSGGRKNKLTPFMPMLMDDLPDTEHLSFPDPTQIAGTESDLSEAEIRMIEAETAPLGSNPRVDCTDDEVEGSKPQANFLSSVFNLFTKETAHDESDGD